jgi:energy-coupling factor transporter transmembrane protein EcfT
MAYLAGLVISALFFLALHYFTELTKSQKVIVSGVVLSIILFAIAYNIQSSEQSDKIRDVVIRYNQGKTVQCNGVDVNKTNYTLSIGTYTFIGKKETPHYAQMISASTCE